MTYEQIVEKLKDEDKYMISNSYCQWKYEEEYGKIVTVEEVGGGEGEGELVERVLHFIDHDIYVYFTGFYESNNGTEWYDEFTQVFPKKVITTIYLDKEEFDKPRDDEYKG